VLGKYSVSEMGFALLTLVVLALGDLEEAGVFVYSRLLLDLAGAAVSFLVARANKSCCCCSFLAFLASVLEGEVEGGGIVGCFGTSGD